MRTVIELRRPLGSVPVKEIELDASSRDDIPALPVGIQAIYKDEALRNELFALPDGRILLDRRRDTGRPGMDLWAVLVMGVLKQCLRCDYDRLQDLVNCHMKVRQMLDHGNLDESECEIQNIRDKVELMTPELLREAGRLIARADAKLSRKEPGAPLIGRCDSFVAKTDVYHPTDFNLLRDSVRCLLRETARACGDSGVPGWQQWRHRRRNLEALQRRAGLLRNGKRRTGTDRRQRRAWEAWSIQAPNSKPQNSTQTNCPQAFHALHAAENAKQPDAGKQPHDAANRTPKLRINAKRVQPIDISQKKP